MRINEGAGIGIAIGNLQKKTGTVKIKRKYFVSCRAHARHLNISEMLHCVQHDQVHVISLCHVERMRDI